MGVTDRIAVLDFGQKIAEGSPAEVQRRPEGDRGVPGSARRCFLSSRTSHVHYGRIEALKGISLDGRRGRDRHPDRRQRRRQDHHAAEPSPGCARSPRAAITFDGEDISSCPADQRVVRLGIGQSPEGRGIFPGMTVHGEPATWAPTPAGTRRGIAADLERVLRAVPAAGRAAQAGRRHAVRRRAADARHRPGADGQPQAAAARRAVDGSGAACSSQQIFAIIKEINQQGITVLLVEQNAQQALRSAHRGYVLETGRIVKDGPGAGAAATTRRSRRRTSAWPEPPERRPVTPARGGRPSRSGGRRFGVVSPGAAGQGCRCDGLESLP